MYKILISIVFILIANFSFADTVVLKSGAKLEGKILEDTKESIKLKIGDATSTIFKDEVVSIKKESTVQDYLLRVEQFNKNGLYDQAERILREAILNYPSEAKLWALLGDTLLEQGKSSEALDNFQKSIKLDANCPEAHHGLGMYYMKELNYGMAIAEFKQTLKINPDFGPAYYGLGEACLANKQYNEAEAALIKATQYMPDHAMSFASLAIARLKSDKFDLLKANSKQMANIVEVMVKAKKLDITNQLVDAWIRDQLEQFYLSKESPQMGPQERNLYNIAYSILVEYTAKSAQDNRPKTFFYFSLGSMYFGLRKDYDASLEMFQKCLEELNKGKADIQEDIKGQMPGFIYARLGDIYFIKGNKSLAEEYYNKSTKSGYQDSSAHYGLGRIYEEKGLIDKAIEEYEKASKLNRYKVEAKDALERLKSQRPK